MRFGTLLAMTLLMGSELFGGGIWLSFEAAGGAPAFTFVKVAGCEGALMEKAEITGSAEGWVAGRRVSMPVVLERTSEVGKFAVRWERPSTGEWALAFEVYPLGRSGVSAVGAVKVREGGVGEGTMLLSNGVGWRDALVAGALSGGVPFTGAAVLPPRLR